jgi:polyhydroxyalkanoate synthesis regulator phasin
MTDNGDRLDGPAGLQQLLLAGVGWLSEGIEAADAFADELARRIGADRDQMRTAVRDTIASWRREAERLGARGDDLTERATSRFGVARRESVEDLELRVAQLEHRVRLLERETDTEITP